MTTIGDELTSKGVALPSLDALDHVDDLEGIFRKYGYEPTDFDDWYNMALDIATWQQRMNAYYQVEQSWQTISKESGTYSTHPTQARIDIKEFMGEGVTEPWSLEAVMDELQEFISAAQTSPEKAIMAALERMPKVRYEPYKKAVREAMVQRGLGAIGPLFSVEFDDSQFAKSINEFERLVAQCFGDRELWRRVTNAVFEEQLVLTHMQDLLVALVSRSEEDSTQPLPLPIVQYRNVASTILNKLPTIERLIGTFRAMPEASGLFEIEQGELNNVSSIISSMQYMIRADLAQVEQAESPSEILAFLDQYANDLNEARQMADSLQSRASTIAAAPAVAHTEFDHVTGKRLQHGLSVTQTAEKIRNFYSSLATSITLIQRSVDEMRNFMPQTPSTREMQRYATERKETRAREAASGNVERLRSDFWDVRIKHSSTKEGTPEVTYEVHGFGEAVRTRLKEIGMYSSELWDEFEEAEQKIFASAADRAEKAWQGYVDEHFSNWAGRA